MQLSSPILLIVFSNALVFFATTYSLMANPCERIIESVDTALVNRIFEPVASRAVIDNAVQIALVKIWRACARGEPVENATKLTVEAVSKILTFKHDRAAGVFANRGEPGDPSAYPELFGPLPPQIGRTNPLSAKEKTCHWYRESTGKSLLQHEADYLLDGYIPREVVIDRAMALAAKVDEASLAATYLLFQGYSFQEIEKCLDIKPGSAKSKIIATQSEVHKLLSNTTHWTGPSFFWPVAVVGTIVLAIVFLGITAPGQDPGKSTSFAQPSAYSPLGSKDEGPSPASQNLPSDIVRHAERQRDVLRR